MFLITVSHKVQLNVQFSVTLLATGGIGNRCCMTFIHSLLLLLVT